jgi:hypothetical protein
MYDYWLGGSHNFAADRAAGDRAAAAIPAIRQIVQANRAFLGRAVRFVVGRGVDQFLDLGAGLPTMGSVHEVAQAADPAARVAYVDLDPVAVAYAARLLRDNRLAIAVHGDLRQPQQLLRHEAIRGLLDFGRPVALVLCAVLHFVVDDAESDAIVRTLRAALASGSYLVLSHAAYDYLPPREREQVERLSAATGTPLRARDPAQIARYLDGLELAEPGLVYLPLWRPDDPAGLFRDAPEQSAGYAAVGRKS